MQIFYFIVFVSLICSIIANDVKDEAEASSLDIEKVAQVLPQQQLQSIYFHKVIQDPTPLKIIELMKTNPAVVEMFLKLKDEKIDAMFPIILRDVLLYEESTILLGKLFSIENLINWSSSTDKKFIMSLGQLQDLVYYAVPAWDFYPHKIEFLAQYIADHAHLITFTQESLPGLKSFFRNLFRWSSRSNSLKAFKILLEIPKLKEILTANELKEEIQNICIVAAARDNLAIVQHIMSLGPTFYKLESLVSTVAKIRKSKTLYYLVHYKFIEHVSQQTYFDTLIKVMNFGDIRSLTGLMKWTHKLSDSQVQTFIKSIYKRTKDAQSESIYYLYIINQDLVARSPPDTVQTIFSSAMYNDYPSVYKFIASNPKMMKHISGLQMTNTICGYALLKGHIIVELLEHPLVAEKFSSEYLTRLLVKSVRHSQITPIEYITKNFGQMLQYFDLRSMIKEFKTYLGYFTRERGQFCIDFVLLLQSEHLIERLKTSDWFFLLRKLLQHSLFDALRLILANENIMKKFSLKELKELKSVAVENQDIASLNSLIETARNQVAPRVQASRGFLGVMHSVQRALSGNHIVV